MHRPDQTLADPSTHWMTRHGVRLFDTAIGRCGIAWGDRGVVAVQLPDGSDQRTLGRMRGRVPGAIHDGAPPVAVRRAVDGITALLRGEDVDLSDIALDMDRVPEFDRRVYEVARTIPPGTTMSYGEIAARVGAPREARAVGQALGRNPFAIVVPCHRVVAANGAIGGFSAHGGTATKLRLLSIEGTAAHVTVPLF
jgi:methylated-DNA-[protein]-cysteine S-methyltransferase